MNISLSHLCLASQEYVLAYNQGLEYYGRGEYDNAIQEYSKAVAVDPKQVPAYVNRGITYFVEGQYVNAITDFTKAITMDPDNVLVLYNRGLAYKDAGMTTEAVTDFENVLRLGKNRNLNNRVRKLMDEMIKPSNKES